MPPTRPLREWTSEQLRMAAARYRWLVKDDPQHADGHRAKLADIEAEQARRRED